MRKLSRFGAAALALALSVTFLTPVQAQAAKNETTASLQLKEKLTDESSVIDTDVITVGDVSGTGVDDAYNDADDNARNNAYKNAVKALADKGLATTTEPAFNCSSREIDGTTYYYSGYSWGDTDYSYAADGTCTCVLKGVYTWKYINSQTKKSSIFRKEVDNNYTADEAKARTFQSAVMVKKGEITYLAVALRGGDTKITGLKSSKKNIAKVSVYKKMSVDATTNADNVKVNYVYDEVAKKGSWVVSYYTTVGAKVIVGTYDDEDKANEAAKNAEMTASSAARCIKIDARAIGKSNLTFNIVNKNGNVSKVKTTIHVVDDTNIFKTLTFAGQSLIDKDQDKKSFYEDGSGDYFTTKAKGKLVAKANKNYIIKKIEVGKLYTENVNKGLDDTYYDSHYEEEKKYSDKYSAYSETGKTTTHKVDLNGDGDFDDTINGVPESNVTYRWKKTKSGKMVKLSTVGENYGSSTSYTYKNSENRNKEKISGSNVSKTRNFTAPTAFRITFFNKITKQYGTTEFTITRPVSK